MALPVILVDPKKGTEATVHSEGYVRVIQSAFPPDAAPKIFPIVKRFSLNNDGTTFDMRVDGSTLPKKFVLHALPETDLYIIDLLLIMVDAGMTAWDEFANILALTNGCSLKWVSQTREAVFGQNLKTNFDMAIMMQFGKMQWYQAGMMGRMSNVIGSAEGLPMQMDLLRMIPPWGLQLRRGTTERLEFTVNDNLSVGIDRLDITAYGFERLPDKFDV